MISFVWAPGQRLPAGTGGSENYTIGQVRELTRRDIPAQVITIGVGADDGRNDFPGIQFRSKATIDQVSELEGSIVFVTFFDRISTPQPAFQMLHIPPPVLHEDARIIREQMRGRKLIAPSTFAARIWSEFLRVPSATINVVHPFAEPEFSQQPRVGRPRHNLRILFAGRLSPEKGIFTLLAMLHNELLGEIEKRAPRVTFTVTSAGADKPQGRIIQKMLQAHPRIDLVPAQKSACAMAKLMARHDIVIMPSNNQYWAETFGIVSVEAQHAGARVVASRSGGLPETDCGALHLVEADNAAALARGILRAIDQGPLSAAARARASKHFTVTQSVDQLLRVVGRDLAILPRKIRAPRAVATIPATRRPTSRTRPSGVASRVRETGNTP